jgi:2-dehydropantoate 2-reductase
MSRVAIIGAGNLGAYLGTQLRAAGHEIFFCVRRKPVPLRFENMPVWQFPVFFRHPPTVDIALMTVKTYDTAAALAWLPELCKNKQPVAVIQNGVGHAERVAPFVAIPVLSYVYVEWRDGVYRAFLPERVQFTIPSLSSCNPFAELFANTDIGVEREGAFHTAAWRKMLHNCVSNPLTTIAGKGLEILQEETYRDLAKGILAEGFQIAQADGARVKATEGDRILKILGSYPPGTRTSMLQDFERGKRLEIDSLNGALIEMGRKYGVPVPVNENVVAMVEARRQQALEQKMAAKQSPGVETTVQAPAAGSRSNRHEPGTTE